VVEFGGQKLAAPLANTKNYANYQIQNLGKIRVADDGNQTFVIKPDPSNWTPFNLRKVTIQSVAGQ
jgi:hypothetical protein